MRKELLPYGEAVTRLRAKYPDLNEKEMVLWVGTLSGPHRLIAYLNSDAAYPHESPVPGMSLDNFLSGCQELNVYEDEYGIQQFSFHGDDSLDDCYFDPEDLDKFIPPEHYLSFQQLVERWKGKKDDIVAFIKEKATKSRKSLDSSFFPYLFPCHYPYRRDTSIEECMFALSDVEACEGKWFPASIVHDTEEQTATPGGDREDAVTDSPTAPRAVQC
ncbi:MAG: hypothetical protein U1F76_10345 [Candidatus Competibacteraceae bacterium]